MLTIFTAVNEISACNWKKVIRWVEKWRPKTFFLTYFGYLC